MAACKAILDKITAGQAKFNDAMKNQVLDILITSMQDPEKLREQPKEVLQNAEPLLYSVSRSGFVCDQQNHRTLFRCSISWGRMLGTIDSY